MNVGQASVQMMVSNEPCELFRVCSRIGIPALVVVIVIQFSLSVNLLSKISINFSLIQIH